MGKLSANDKKCFIRKFLLFLVIVAAGFGICKGAAYLYGRTVYRVSGKESRTYIKPFVDSEFAGCTKTVDGRYTEVKAPEPKGPYLVILLPEHSSYIDESKVIAWSGEGEPSPDNVKTIIFCRYTEKTALYNTSGSGSSGATGTSEFVNISYLDAENAKQYKYESIGKELPGTASSAPHYKVSINKLLSHIKKEMKSDG